MQYINAYVALLRETYEDIEKTVESQTSQGFLLACAVLIPVFGTLFFFTVLVNAAPYTAPAQTAIIEAVQVDKTTIDINLSENTTLLNAVEVEFYFDATHFQVTNLIIAETLCEDRFVITKEIDNGSGRVFYQCGTVNPFSGTSTTLATLTISPIAFGTSTLSFGTSTNVLAHDGYGSNVTKERASSSYSFAG